MKITGDWISQAACQSVCALLNRHGFAAYFVGGCVRNDLLGAPISDLDISTDARPEIVMDLAQAAGIRAVATGIDHGTVTLVIDGRPFEITTFRNDVETDGRHAKVRFSTNIADDAARRDFTMNALYADAAGNIIDPLGGLGDLRARHLRFVGIPQDRIREDYLRILRFFRFTAYYGDPDLGFDADALDAIVRNLDGLAKLSRERVGSEMTKFLSAPDPAPAVAAMRACGVLATLLEGADDRALAPLVHLEQINGMPPDPIRRLAILGGTDVAERLRLSKANTKTLATLRTHIEGMTPLSEVAYRETADIAWSVALCRAAMFETPLPSETGDAISMGATARFPITAGDLIDTVQGAELGQTLRQLEQQWIDGGFRPSTEMLLASFRNTPKQG